ncbi:MAG: hypothetical protein Q3984_03265 [Eubacteriales bacterium]|nr:hypothetical protein [Eubacteriales bacterium]
MYEEDRLRALELYSRMFEEAGDESALIQSLLSPTRQAVVVARAYNVNLGKLSVTSEKKAAPEDRDENGVPDYVQAIEAVRAAAFARQPAPASKTAEETNEAVPAEEAPEETEETAPAAEAAGEPEETAPAAEAAEETEGTAPAEDAKAEEPEETAPAAEANAPAENRTQENIEFFSMPEEGKEEENEGARDGESAFNIDTDLMRQPRRKAKVFALIVYILFAIPITLAAIAILLVPALLFLALSVGSIICGVVTVSAAFSGFAVIADIMVVLGLALVLFALGLLFLWTAIWFIGGAIVGVVHGVAALCDKWCYKEVLD